MSLTPRTRPVSSAVAPTNVAAEILVAVTGTNFSRCGVIFQNPGLVDIYLGGSNVTTSNGFLLKGADDPPALIAIPAPLADGSFWAVTASGTGDLRILEFA